jgi:hypothetical protein
MFIAYIAIRCTVVNVLLIVVISWGWRAIDEARMDMRRASTMR